MPLIVNEQGVRDAGFVRRTSGWYYPSEGDPSHIHLGAFTGPGVPVDSLKIEFVGIKIDGSNLGNLPQFASEKFDVTYRADRWGKSKVPFQQALLRADVGSEP